MAFAAARMLKEKKGKEPRTSKVGMLTKVKSPNVMHTTNNIFQQRSQSITSTTARSGESTPWDGKVFFFSFHHLIWRLAIKHVEIVINIPFQTYGGI